MATDGKELIFDEEARAKLREGIDQLGEVVSVTLGPVGRNVGLGASWGAPSITNDGSSIVKDIELKDQYQNMGASMAKEVVSKMKEKCGDGTTTVLVLLQALVKNGIKYIESGTSPIHVKRGMEHAVQEILKELSSKTVPVVSEEEIKNIATISASGDQEIGSLMAEAFKKAGKEGVITIEEGKSTETVLKTVDGMEFDRGYLSAYFCTNSDKRSVEMHHPKILITDKKISSIQEILPILEQVAGSGQELLIIADDVEGDALSTLVVNKIRGILKVCAVKAPSFGDIRKAMLEDLAILTGATLVSEEQGVVLKESTFEVLGSAEHVIVTKEKTTLVNGGGAQSLILERAKQIGTLLEKTSGKYDREKLEERRGKLLGGVVMIQVGAATEPEMKQKKQAFEDSLNSTRAALEQGVVVGGGTALVRAARAAVDKLKLQGPELIGAQIVKQACLEPLKQIVKNCGMNGTLILEEVLSKEGNMGFNAVTGEIEDLFLAGVVDPLKVVALSLQLAVSTASMVMMTEALIGNG